MSIGRWISKRLDLLIQKSTTSSHENAKQDIIQCLFSGEKGLNEAKRLFQKEFERYHDILKYTEKSEFAIQEKLTEFYQWFQMTLISFQSTK
jgi:hypothetical protein